MKTILCLIIPVFGMTIFNASAQTPAQLSIQTYAGLTITGEVGMV